MELPIDKQQALLVASFLELHFGDKIKEAVAGTPFGVNHIIAIACQESASDWIDFIHTKTPEQILALQVSDPTGDEPGTSRHAWPQNLSVFKESFPTIAPMLVAEGNKYRAAKNWAPRQWLYKGYGIFQYDIQNIKTDKDFFVNKLWYNIDDCLKRVISELHDKYAIEKDVWLSIERYNGAGSAAVAYMANVKQFYTWIS